MIDLESGAVLTGFAAMSGVVGKLWTDVRSLTASLLKCETKHATVSAQLSALETTCDGLRSECKSMQEKLDHVHDQVPETLAAVYVTATIPEGVILSVTPSVTGLLGWLPEDLEGQSVDVLVADEFTERHREAMQESVEKGHLRDDIHAFKAYAKAKSGRRVPVLVSIAQLSRDPWMAKAQINYRSVN